MKPQCKVASARRGVREERSLKPDEFAIDAVLLAVTE